MLKIVRPLFSLLLIFGFSMTLIGDESANIYFPNTLDSFWVYEDQDGNELTRYAVEGEEIDGETYPAFSYDPELEDWVDYSPFIHPFLYKVSDAGITLVAGDEVENAFKAGFKKEIDSFMNLIKEHAPPEIDTSVFEMDVEVEAQVQELMFLLPKDIVVDEEWDVNYIEAKVKLIPLAPDVPEGEQLLIDYTISETGIVLGTETVEIEAGTFEDCLKVEYRTETTAVMTPAPPPDDVEPPGETVTTVWFAPNVGIVKIHQKSGHLFLDMIPKDEGFPFALLPHKERTLELKSYEIKTAESESNESD